MKLKGPLKVTISLGKDLHPMWVTPEGLKFNDTFIDRYYEMDEYFRERIILPINDLAGNNWAVHFTEKPVQDPTYLVDITVDDAYIRPIINIICQAFPDVTLDFWKPTRPFVHLGKRPALSR